MCLLPLFFLVLLIANKQYIKEATIENFQHMFLRIWQNLSYLLYIYYGATDDFPACRLMYKSNTYVCMCSHKNKSFFVHSFVFLSFFGLKSPCKHKKNKNEIYFYGFIKHAIIFVFIMEIKRNILLHQI